MVATKDVSPQNRAVSGKRVFVDVVKDIKVRSSRVRVTFNPTDRVLLRDKEDTVEEPLKGRGRMGERGPQAQGPLKPLKLEKSGRTLSWSLWRDLSPVPC